jgi:hypothetical protein
MAADRAVPADGGMRDIETIFADRVICCDAGETVRLLLFTDLPDGRDGVAGSRLLQVAMPRSGFLAGLVAAADRFLDGAGTARGPTLN